MIDHRMGWPGLAAMIAEAFPRPAARPLIVTPRATVDQAARAALDLDPSREVMLPEGICERGPGEYEAVCCCCGEWRELYCDLSEIPEVGYEHYCGGSQRCCP